MTDIIEFDVHDALGVRDVVLEEVLMELASMRQLQEVQENWSFLFRGGNDWLDTGRMRTTQHDQTQTWTTA